jgi:hypothetical protein
MSESLSALKLVHEQQFHTLLGLIKQNHCKNVYLDIGTNIGVQIRKLYQPQGYPDALILPFFTKYFGNSRKDVCAIGFEPNAVHTPRLLNLQTVYRNASFPCVIFTNTAVGNHDGNITFYNDPSAAPIHHEWGASMFKWQANSVPQIALQIDADKFVHNLIHHWSRTTSYTNNSIVIAKMDVEGAEYVVLPHMLSHGSLCHIDFIMIEWHLAFYKDAVAFDKDMEKLLHYFTGRSQFCKFHVINLDDESYVNDTSLDLPDSSRLLTLMKRV